MKLSSFTQLTGRVSRLALLALAVSLAGVGQAKQQWHVYDVLGNTVASVNADAVVAEIESTAFGESRTPTAGARFTGKPYDNDMGAHVFPFRNYRSDSGRWTSADPSGFPDGVNNSYYAPIDAPFSSVDPLGLAIVQHTGNQWSPTLSTNSIISAFNNALNNALPTYTSIQGITAAYLSNQITSWVTDSWSGTTVSPIQTTINYQADVVRPANTWSGPTITTGPGSFTRTATANFSNTIQLTFNYSLALVMTSSNVTGTASGTGDRYYTVSGNITPTLTASISVTAQAIAGFTFAGSGSATSTALTKSYMLAE
jgi:RHS repeat-associated protein